MKRTNHSARHPRPRAQDRLPSFGALALSARMKRVSDGMVHDARHLYEELGIDIEPNWYLLFMLLEEHGRMSVTEIATALGWAHPSVVKLTKNMLQRGLLDSEGDPDDQRVTLLRLSAAGRARSKEAMPVWEASRRGLEELLQETGVDLMSALDALDVALAQRSFRERTLSKLAVPPGPARTST